MPTWAGKVARVPGPDKTIVPFLCLEDRAGNKMEGFLQTRFYLNFLDPQIQLPSASTPASWGWYLKHKLHQQIVTLLGTVILIKCRHCWQSQALLAAALRLTLWKKSRDQLWVCSLETVWSKAVEGLRRQGFTQRHHCCNPTLSWCVYMCIFPAGGALLLSKWKTYRPPFL